MLKIVYFVLTMGLALPFNSASANSVSDLAASDFHFLKARTLKLTPNMEIGAGAAGLVIGGALLRPAMHARRTIGELIAMVCSGEITCEEVRRSLGKQTAIAGVKFTATLGVLLVRGVIIAGVTLAADGIYKRVAGTRMGPFEKTWEVFVSDTVKTAGATTLVEYYLGEGFGEFLELEPHHAQMFFGNRQLADRLHAVAGLIRHIEDLSRAHQVH